MWYWGHQQISLEDVCSGANYFSKSEISYFVLIGSHGIFQGPALETVLFFLLILLKTYQVEVF